MIDGTDQEPQETPDSGDDINTPLTIQREDLRTLKLAPKEVHDAVMDALEEWLVFGNYAPPSDRRALMLFNCIAQKHCKAVANHRVNKAQQAQKANLRWGSKGGRKATAMPRQCDGNATAMPTITNTITNTNISPTGGGGNSRGRARGKSTTAGAGGKSYAGKRKRQPTREEVEEAAKEMGILDNTVERWLERMIHEDWRFSGGDKVTAADFRKSLRAFAEIEEDNR